MQAEWEEQAATWLAMPINEENWAPRRERIDAFYSKLIETILKFQPVKVLDDLKIPHNDIWIRDYGPFFMKDCIVEYEFNAWGEKFPPWDLDNLVPKKIAELMNLPVKSFPWILEGGAVEFNGDGLCVTTEPCLCGKTRNAADKREELLNDIKTSFNLKSILVLPDGLPGDHTDGHIDNLARFVSKNRIVMAEGFDANLVKNYLQKYYEGVVVDTLPLPALGEPKSYMNFIFVNGGLIVPTYNCAFDEVALDYFKRIFSDREVIGMDCSVPIEEGGSLHCLSKQEIYS
jgi:agmatine deiminase